MKKILFVCSVLLALAACSGEAPEQTPPSAASHAAGPLKPLENEDARNASRGRLTGESGLNLFGRSSEDEAAAASTPIGVNSYLWRATLDTLSFMPLVSADPFGGVIITDWYEDPRTPGERFKVNAFILDKSLRADGVKIKVFKEQQAGAKGTWRTQQVDEKLSRSLEDTILTRARQMKVASGK